MVVIILGFAPGIRKRDGVWRVMLKETRIGILKVKQDQWIFKVLILRHSHLELQKNTVVSSWNLNKLWKVFDVTTATVLWVFFFQPATILFFFPAWGDKLDELAEEIRQQGGWHISFWWGSEQTEYSQLLHPDTSANFLQWVDWVTSESFQESVWILHSYSYSYDTSKGVCVTCLNLCKCIWRRFFLMFNDLVTVATRHATLDVFIPWRIGESSDWPTAEVHVAVHGARASHSAPKTFETWKATICQIFSSDVFLSLIKI